MDQIYCYLGSNVLINRLNIRDEDTLFEAEKVLVAFRVLEQIETPVKGKFDFMHLKMIHKQLFQDIYPWAGKVRTVDIAKGNMFCKVQFIETMAQDIFSQLRKENYLRDLDRDSFIVRLAYYFSEINALHPFREGNGRTQREFIRQLAAQAGYTIRFSAVSYEEMLEASIASFMCDYSKMEAVYRKCVVS